ncbi:MAG: BREX-2 system adenine-specific DNA-methyltransferase PglX, partial [Actinobacteria bacterium]|nr:BREX-2 system adenine-specific DNA-methyltransferase PglX [Actinomycetota bacterium]
TEDSHQLRATFGRTYSAVVGNPPYIVPKDPKANAAYRRDYTSCHRQYSLGVPFTELFFTLADRPDPTTGTAAGQVGMITANSFMKREFGKKLIEQLIPRWDLTHVVDTSGAYIPGHGTPTVILFGRNQTPVADTIRSVMGIRGEPSTPADPTKGLVWSAIIAQIDEPGSESDYVSVADTERSRFASHPWSIGGGGAAELKEQLDTGSTAMQVLIEPPIGRAVRIGSDELFEIDRATRMRQQIADVQVRNYLVGERVRDWIASPSVEAIYPYGPLFSVQEFEQLRWSWRTTLRERRTFQGVMADAGLSWWDYMQHTPSAYESSLSITFSNVATHNQFALDRGGCPVRC